MKVIGVMRSTPVYVWNPSARQKPHGYVDAPRGLSALLSKTKLFVEIEMSDLSVQ